MSVCVCVCLGCARDVKKKRKKDEYETEGAPYCPVRRVAIFRLLIPSRHIFETVSQLKVEVYKKKEHREREISDGLNSSVFESLRPGIPPLT